MAVKIKLKRLGKIRNPQYRIVVADARTKRDGRAIEEIGKYHPKQEPSLIEVNSERAQYWLSVGAQPTDPVLAILKITGDWQKFKGEPGAEGTLKVAEPKVDKKALFNAIARQSVNEGEGAATATRAKRKAEPKAGKAKAEKADKPEAKPEAKADKPEAKADKPEAKAEKADKAEPKADKADKADKAEPKAEKADKTEAKADKAKADADTSEAKAAEPAEATAETTEAKSED